MRDFNRQESSSLNYDIVICGGGVAGLWLLNVLIKAGYSVLLVEKDAIGGIQSIASQGMIHGGQRYLLGSNLSTHAKSVALLPERWNACLEGRGDVDLREVRILSETQLMWPTGGRLTRLALNAATHLVKAKMRHLDPWEIPDALTGFADRPILELPEKVLDIGSLVEVLSAPHGANIRKGVVGSLTREGRLTVSGIPIIAQVVICAAGLGNEEFLVSLDAGKHCSQQRPIRQLMVKMMPFPLYGHGITTSYKPRVTITSQPLLSGGYVWYIGGALGDDVLSLKENQAINYARKEMAALFDRIDWGGKEWATWDGVRAEAFSHNGLLPDGPVIQEYDGVMVVWPTKLTLTPTLGDGVLERLSEKRVWPKYPNPPFPPSNLTMPVRAPFPWEVARWTSLISDNSHR
jgi:glycine/D-amino acid oxidase-like deaminating enzyme